MIGPSGSGKTLGARYYGTKALEYAEAKGIPFSVVYLNCREIASRYAFWQLLLAELGTHVPKGFSISDLVGRFAQEASGREAPGWQPWPGAASCQAERRLRDAAPPRCAWFPCHFDFYT